MAYDPRIELPSDALGANGLVEMPKVYRHYLADFAERRGGLRAALRECGPDPMTFEHMRLLSAELLDCDYCRNVRYASAQQAGFDESVVAELDDFEAAALPESYKRAMRLVEVVARGDSASPDLRRALRETFDDSGIAGLLAAIFEMRTFAKVRIVLGMEPRDLPTTVIAG